MVDRVEPCNGYLRLFFACINLSAKYRSAHIVQHRSRPYFRWRDE